MPARKMRVELFDGEGNRYTVAFEGQITREKALKLLDLLELLGGVPSGGGSIGGSAPSPMDEPSRFDKVRQVIQKHFPVVWFSSREVQTVYEQVLKEPVGLSTIATYLARLTDRGFIMKAGQSNRLVYKLVLRGQEALLNPQIRKSKGP